MKTEDETDPAQAAQAAAASAAAAAALAKVGRVGVLMGGPSAEREVSLQTGAGVLAALCERGHDAVGLDWKAGESLPRLIEDSGVSAVWNALHGTYGEDGAVQGLLACMQIPCTGSGIMASAIAMDKVMSKRIFELHDLATPAWTLVPRDVSLADATRLLADWEPPLVVKPASEGSSVGVTILGPGAVAADVAAAVARARSYHGPTIAERYIAGAEIQVAILGTRVLGAIEVRPKVAFYDYQAKYERDDTEYIIPAPLAADAVAAAEQLALDAYLALACTGYGRVDLRVDDAGAPYLLEVNTLPGMTSHSLLPKIAAHAGIDYASLCEQILALALV